MGLIPPFASRREPLWRQLAERLGGTFVNEPGAAFDKLVVHEAPWTVTLDVHDYPGYKMAERFTRMRAPFVNADAFRFVIHRRNLFEQVTARLGLHHALGEVATGYPEIDRDFIVRSNSPDQLRRMLANPRLRALLTALPEVHFQVRPDGGQFGPQFPEGVDELYLETPGQVTDMARLATMFDLFAETLHSLCQIGSAYESDPHLTL